MVEADDVRTAHEIRELRDRLPADKLPTRCLAAAHDA
jgi:hypothetical protein